MIFIQISLFYLQKDQSISSRIQHLLIPFLAFFRDFGMPHAFNGLKASAKFLVQIIRISSFNKLHKVYVLHG